MYCPHCQRTDDRPQAWTPPRRISIDGAWRTYRKHRACGTAVASAVAAGVR